VPSCARCCDRAGARSCPTSTLRKLRRWDEAREEIQRAIECKQPFGHAAEPWTSWAVLADIETGAGRADRAAQAKVRARDCYLVYRRDGGENHYSDGRIALAMTELLLAGDVAGVVAELDSQLVPRRRDFDRLTPVMKLVDSRSIPGPCQPVIFSAARY
jgi:hypothetical protein